MKKIELDTTELLQPEITHIDDWLDDPQEWRGLGKDYNSVMYAKFILDQMRWPAWKLSYYRKFMQDAGLILFCTYGNKRYRVTGARRLGDVWLAKDFTRDSGYDLRVNVTECSGWSKVPIL